MSDATILYLDMVPGDRINEMMLAGIRRYADVRGWCVETVPWDRSSLEDVGKLLAERSPIGCIVGDSTLAAPLPPRVFGKIPAVYVGDDTAAAHKAVRVPRVAIDEEAVARAAFRELSSGQPEAYATVIFRQPRPWSLAREAAFRAIVATEGKPCLSFRYPRPSPEKFSDREKRLVRWVASLPRHTAVFAVNDDSAAAVVAAAGKVFRQIPRDLTLLGVDNDPVICEASHPTISSIQMDFENAGFHAARVLGSMIDKDDCFRLTRRHGATEKKEDLRAYKPPISMFGESNAVVLGPLLAVRRESTSGSGRREPHVMAAIEMIRREACEGLTAREAIARSPGSRRLFELRFREATGHSVLDEIRHVRLQKAYAILAGTDTPIGAIADMCGYDCASTLDKLFRKREGMSMQEWRRLHRR